MVDRQPAAHDPGGAVEHEEDQDPERREHEGEEPRVVPALAREAVLDDVPGGPAEGRRERQREDPEVPAHPARDRERAFVGKDERLAFVFRRLRFDIRFRVARHVNLPKAR